MIENSKEDQVQFFPNEYIVECLCPIRTGGFGADRGEVNPTAFRSVSGSGFCFKGKPEAI